MGSYEDKKLKSETEKKFFWQREPMQRHFSWQLEPTDEKHFSWQHESPQTFGWENETGSFYDWGLSGDNSL